MIKNSIVVVLMVVAITGCVYFTSWDDVMRGWVDHHIDEITNLWGEPDEITINSNNQREYKYHRKRIAPSCIHYWVVNQEGKITGFHYEGRCRPIG